MKQLTLALATGLALAAAPVPVLAQAANTALGEAKARVACGADTILSAQTMPDGSVKVTCQRNNLDTQSGNNPLDTAGLSTGASVGIASAVVVLGIALGSDNGTVATTTSP